MMLALYGLPGRGKPGICAPPRGFSAVQPDRRITSSGSHPRNGFLRSSTRFSARFSAPAWRCWRSISLPMRCLRPTSPGKAGLCRSRCREHEGPASEAARRAPEEPLPVRLASADVKPRRDIGQEMPGLPHLREGWPEPRRPQSLGRRRPGTGTRSRLQLFRGDEEPERELGRSSSSTSYLTNPRGEVPGTNMTFAGLPRGKRARRRDRLSSTRSPTIRCRCRRWPLLRHRKSRPQRRRRQALRQPRRSPRRRRLPPGCATGCRRSRSAFAGCRTARANCSGSAAVGSAGRHHAACGRPGGAQAAIGAASHGCDGLAVS